MKASEEIRSILDRCKSGELRHNQTAYFCGSARCVAGWKVQFDYCAEYQVKRPSIAALELFADQKTPEREFNPLWQYAKDAWGLTSRQSYRLLDANATYDEQYAVVEELEAQGK